LRVHVITHVPYEGPAAIRDWALGRGHEFTETASVTEAYPKRRSVELLAIMGGPMDADDEVANPWLAAEKRFVADVLSAGASVIGVCLGAQILAEVIGGKITRNPEPEVGWYEVRLTGAGRAEPLFTPWPGAFIAGHWHGDTFELPDGVRTCASSAACENQLFIAADGRAIGIQFHLEWDRLGLSSLLAACEDDLDRGGDYVASAERLLQGVDQHGGRCRELLYDLLDTIEHGKRGILG
jgi:GMP synthase-like glutamine amidotransferase